MTKLHGSREKLRRARLHLETFEGEAKRFLDSKPYPLVKEFDSETLTYRFRVKVLREPNWDDWSLILGDCFHNLRSALDYITWWLAEATHPFDGFDIATQFPIFVSETLFDEKAPRQMWRLSATAKTLIRELQPFHRPDPKSGSLWAIHDLNNADKHRLLSFTTSILEEPHINWSSVTADAARGALSIKGFGGAFKDGAVILEVGVGDMDTEVDVDSDPTFSVAFGKSGVTGTALYRPDAPRRIANVVEQVIVIFEEKAETLIP